MDISPEKAADLDFSYARDELRARGEFNKRVQQLQFTAFGALLISSQLAGHLRLISLIGLLLNYVFLHEIIKNITYQRLAALYIVKVVNKRYTPPICEWELFITIMRKGSASFSNRYLHYVESSILTPIAAVVICIFLFIRSFTSQSSQTSLSMGAPLFAVLLALNVYGMFVHIRNRRALWGMFSEKELEEFSKRYGVTQE